jgi:hypothetical protein
MRFVPDARTYHQHADTLSDYVCKKFRIAWWKAAVLRKHPRRAIHDSHTPQTLKLQIASTYAVCATAAFLALHRRSGRAWLALAIALGVYVSLIAEFVVRSASRDPAVAVAAPAILFCRDMALGAGLGMGLLQTAGRSAMVSQG